MVPCPDPLGSLLQVLCSSPPMPALLQRIALWRGGEAEMQGVSTPASKLSPSQYTSQYTDWCERLKSSSFVL